MSTPAAANTRLARYETRSSGVMVGLAVIYFGVYAAQILWLSAPEWALIVLGLLAIGIWMVFVADLTVRVVLSDRKWRYLAAHPLDVVAVILPMFRALRVLRVFTAGQWFVSRGKNLAIGRTYLAIAVGASSIAIIAALAFFDAEYSDPDSGIDSFGDALWWAIVTMSTVGYGDVYPVTATGRIVAAALMVFGISLLGIITATVATWFIEQTREIVNPPQRRRRRQPTMIPSRRMRRERSRLAGSTSGRRTDPGDRRAHD